MVFDDSMFLTQYSSIKRPSVSLIERPSLPQIRLKKFIKILVYTEAANNAMIIVIIYIIYIII
jgi:hypothetical protein